MIINYNNKPIKKIICNGRLLSLGGPAKIMGIINLTPDSFSDGGLAIDPETALEQALMMETDGADLLDLGAESSRPGHSIITISEERKRLLPALKKIISQTSLPISVDTWKSEVAEAALAEGAAIINDIYGLKKDPALARIIARYQAGVIIMHNQDHNHYPDGMISSIMSSLQESIDIALDAGIDKEKIILDPGIGFGKNAAQNIDLLGQLSDLSIAGYPLLLGASRKSFIASVDNVPPKDRLPGTIATTVLGLAQGYEFFRVHDAKENKQALRVTEEILRRHHG